MMELEEAQQRILALTRPLGIESVSLLEAAGRILAQRVLAPIDLPPFDNSAMDGYAVRAEDVAGANPDRPVRLRLAGRIAAGQPGLNLLQSGDCVRLFTGSPLPPGADAVVMQEDTRILAEDPDHPVVLDSAKPWENVRFKGEDVKRGTVLMDGGRRLSPADIGLLAAMGHSSIQVVQRPMLGLIATGSELREPGQALAPGQIYESNRAMLSALASRMGARPRVYPLVKDNLAETRAALTQAFTECDLVVSSGGVSVGEFDFVKAAFQELGGELEFWRVAVKPGKPFVFGRWQESLFFGLPGNPVSAFVTFLLLVRPALLRCGGAQDTGLQLQPGVLAERLLNPGDRRHFMRVAFEGNGQVRPLKGQASHLLHSLAEADGLVDVPARTMLDAGTAVRVLRW